MPAITNSAREEMRHLIDKEMSMVDEKAKKTADESWSKTEDVVAKRLGYGDKIAHAEHLRNQIKALQMELAALEGGIPERAVLATVEEYREAGLEVNVDRFGQPYRPPIVFGREIKSRWDALVLMELNRGVDFFRVYIGLSQLRHSVLRALAFTGTYEEARAMYQKFFEEVRHALGDSLPPMLSGGRHDLPQIGPGRQETP